MKIMHKLITSIYYKIGQSIKQRNVSHRNKKEFILFTILRFSLSEKMNPVKKEKNG